MDETITYAAGKAAAARKVRERLAARSILAEPHSWKANTLVVHIPVGMTRDQLFALCDQLRAED